jgi:YVTN family beta-propeller protein
MRGVVVKKILISLCSLNAAPGSAVLLMTVAVWLLVSGLPIRRVPIVTAQTVIATGDLRELAIDDGVAECTLGPDPALKGKPGFGWVNKLTPPSYPATIRAVTIGFERLFEVTGVKPDSLYRIVVYLDPEGDGPGNQQRPDATFIGRARGTDEIMTFNLTTPLTIQGGSFVVGAMDEYGIANLPALFDSPGKSNPPGSESFFTYNGGARWQKLSDALPPAPHCSPGSWLIRATVELGAVDPLAVLKIKDPAAVEPWGVGVLNNNVIITNLVSDNLTIINAITNSFQSVPLVDPRVCATCGPPLGPYGVAGVRDTNPVPKLYVTLFGSNTIPSKEFPTSYATVLPGRVVVLQAFADGFVQSGFISVGTGPRFPVVAAGKLYVPCGGANRVDVISTTADLKIGEIPVGSDPSSCSASLDGSKIYVTNFGDGTISVIDTKSDKKIKDIPAPPIQFPLSIGATPATLPRPAIAQNPWNSTVSSSNGNLYVTYWSSTAGDVTPNGALVEFNTCTDEFVRAIIDDTTFGTPSGSPGATGIPAPTAPLIRDPATGKTLEAGGGGGGPFGVSACVHSPFGNPREQFPTVVFTNDALGIAGVLDTRIDQVVSAPPITVASCSKPRGIACRTVTSLPPHFAFVACGQPDSSVLMFRVPELPENISNISVIQSAEIGDVFRLIGTGFAKFDMRIEVERAGVCLTFKKPAKTKQGATVVLQKGPLSDGSRLTDSINQTAIIRLVHPNGTVRVIPH